MDIEFFRKVFKYRNPELHSWIYEVPFSCLIPFSASVNEIERNIRSLPVLSLNSNTGGGYYGEDDYGDSEKYVDDFVDDMFTGYEEDIRSDVYALNRPTSVRITVLEMAKHYHEGNFVYLNNPVELKKVYGLLEGFVDYKLKYYKGPNTGNGMENDTDLFLLDKLATSMVNIYEEDDRELYYYTKKGFDPRAHLSRRPSKKVDEIVIRKESRKRVVKVSRERLRELGL